MEITTTTSIVVELNTTTQPITSSRDPFPSYVNPITVIRIYQIGYSLIFLLGFPGNIASLLTFSRPTLRKVSTGCLFIVLATADLLYLLVCIVDYLEFGLSISFRQLAYSDFCRLRSFIMGVSQTASAWTLVIVSLDRWIRTRFPFKSASICTPKKALLAMSVMLIADIALYAHMLTPLFGTFISGLAIAACGPSFSDRSYLMFYYMQWGIIQIFTTCVVPAIIMSLVLIDILISVRMRKNTVMRFNQAGDVDKNSQRKKTLQKQMFILMFGSVCIFLVTSLPVAIYKIISPRGSNISKTILEVVSIWTGLGWFQSLLYAVGFYIHCLSSNLFRRELQAQMKSLMGKEQSRVNPGEMTLRDRHAVTLQTIRKY